MTNRSSSRRRHRGGHTTPIHHNISATDSHVDHVLRANYSEESKRSTSSRRSRSRQRGGEGHHYASRRELPSTVVQQDASFYTHDSTGLRASESEDSAAVNWRGNPKINGSDWTIHVVSEEHSASYHVHRNYICFGKRSSKYFARIMSDVKMPSNITTRKKRSSQLSCKVDLELRDAANFPIVLDFLYGESAVSATGTMLTANSTDDLSSFPSLKSTSTLDDDRSFLHCTVDELTTDNAVSVRYLAKKFEIETLVIVTNRFIQTDLTTENCVSYLKDATRYNDGRLYQSAKKLWVENFESIPKRDLASLPLDTFRDLIVSLGSKGEENELDSHYISDIVCRYFEKNRQELNAKDLLELTDVSRIPSIASEAAITITALIRDLKSEDVKENWDALVQLSQRCARPVVFDYGWSDFSVEAAVDEYLGRCRKATEGPSRAESLLFATSFAAALQQAQDDYCRLQEEQDSIEDTVKLLGESFTIMERMNCKKDEQLTRQQRAIDEAQRQISMLRDELRQMQNFPLVETKRTMETVSELYPSASEAMDTLGSATTFMSEDEEGPASVTTFKSSPLRDLISPCQIGLGIPQLKSRKHAELRTRAEMRTRSIMK